jgi:nitrogen regulatory protein P-II 1
MTVTRKIVDELVNSFGEASEHYGVLFVKDVTDAYQLGTKLVGLSDPNLPFRIYPPV